MLSVHGVKSAVHAVKYYEQDNYYHKGSVEAIAATHWWGKGAKNLGLSDYVDPEKFAELLQGKINKNTTIGRIRHDGGVDHRPGYDLTFSAPKSVSMLAEIGLDYRLHEAHDKAVNAALNYLETKVAKYRQTIDGDTQIKLADNLIIAKFRHDTSREVDGTVDCQLHTHSVVLNAVLCQDGKWRSLFADSIFDYKMLGGMVYRAALAKAVKALGYQIEQTREDGLFEIVGFTLEQREHFSNRRVKICEVMAEKGLFGAQAAEAITLSLRESKAEIDRDKLHAAWQSRAKELGLDLGEMIICSQKKQKTCRSEIEDPTLVAEQALTYAIKHLSEREAVFKERDLVRTALAYSLGEIICEDVQDALKRFEQAQKLIYLGEHEHTALYTSPEIKAREDNIVQIMQRGKNEVSAIASTDVVQLFINDTLDSSPEGLVFTNCQRQSIEFLITSTDRIAGIQGYAGTGKTTMLSAVCRIAQETGLAIRGAAPSAAAANVLRLETGIETDTLSALIISLNSESLSDPLVDTSELIILDEASMASTHQMETLLKRIEKLNKRLFLVGDRDQLPAVEIGAPFALLQDEGMNQATLRQIVRQKSLNLSYAVETTIDRKIEHAFELIQSTVHSPNHSSDSWTFSNPASAVIAIEDKPSRLAAISKKYLSLDEQERDNTFVLLGSNEDRQLVNDAIRKGLKRENKVDGPEIECSILQNKGMTIAKKTHILNYEIGDILRFNKQYRGLGIKRFDYLTVSAIDKHNKKLILDKNGKKIIWDPEKSAKTKGGAVEVFVKGKRTLAAGDYIRWTQNKKNKGIYNTETAKVINIEDQVAHVKTKNDQVIAVNVKQYIDMHWDYAWSSTIYAAQGNKSLSVIGLIESYDKNLTHFRSFYVLLSRTVNSIYLYVDDLQKCIKTITEKTGEKSNATTFLKSFETQQKFEETLRSAHIKLNGNIYEIDNRFERLDLLAKDYSTLHDKDAACLIVTDNRDRIILNALIRDELKKTGVLNKRDVLVPVLHQTYIRNHHGRITLEKDMIISFDSAYKKYDIAKGDSFMVKETRDIDNSVVLQKSVGKEITLNIDFLMAQQGKHLHIYKPEKNLLSVGDKITWTKTNKKEMMLLGQHATIKEVSKEFVTIALNNKKNVTFSTDDNRYMHWRYSYANQLSDPLPKQYAIGLSWLDDKVKSPVKVKALFGAMGKATKAAYIYTHSGNYVNEQYQLVTQTKTCLNFSERKPVKNPFFSTLNQFDKSKLTLSKAWVSYFASKEKGINTTENIKNAVMLDRAHAEVATKLIADPYYTHNRIRAFGFNLDSIKKYADKQRIIAQASKYEMSTGLLREKQAKEIWVNRTLFSNELRHKGINTNQLEKEALRYVYRLQQLKLNPVERKAAKVVDQYLQYSQDAKAIWTKVYRVKDRGAKPSVHQFNFGMHLSRIRNRLAFEIQSQPGKFDKFTEDLHNKTRNLIHTHASQHKKVTENEIRSQKVMATKDWRTLLADEKKYNLDQNEKSLNYPIENRRPYWDKNLVLAKIKSAAEQIISGLVTEEKNMRLSHGQQIVWGKKNGSIRYHNQGPKEGIINDYERGIHGDLINYYAKRRGIGWHDALSELAAMTGLTAHQTGLKSTVLTTEEKIKKDKGIIDEQKRQMRMRQVAQKIWDTSKPITDTLVERYLKQHRGMNFDLSKLEVRYHEAAPSIVSYQHNQTRLGNPRPAMVVGFFNDQNELTGVQCTYLNKLTANKDKSALIPKNTIGQIWGSAGTIYRGGSEKVIVAEGCETAASLIPAAPNSSIYITGGNMQNVGHYQFIAELMGKSELHIAADNDLSFTASSWQATERGARQLAQHGIKPLVSRPITINHEKTDFNDTLKLHGQAAVKNQFVPSFEINTHEPITQNTKLQPTHNKVIDRALEI